MTDHLVKVTDREGYSMNATRWGGGVTNRIAPPHRGAALCEAGILHAYRSLPLAILLSPAHVNRHITDSLFWDAEGRVEREDHTKVGCYALTTRALLDLPAWAMEPQAHARVAVLFAALCAEPLLDLIAGIEPSPWPRQAIALAREQAMSGEWDENASESHMHHIVEIQDALELSWASVFDRMQHKRALRAVACTIRAAFYMAIRSSSVDYYHLVVAEAATAVDVAGRVCDNARLHTRIAPHAEEAIRTIVGEGDDGNQKRP